MRVLLTNNTLQHHAGSELYLRDIAATLARRGHSPIAYSEVHGPVADELRAASVHVIEDLNELTVPPDVIHGNQHLETMAALLRFRGVPAIYVCHGWVPWEASPPWHPRIRHYVAVSELLGERLTSSGIPADRVEVLTNAVDLARFRPRADLPLRPRRALVFDNYATEHAYVPLVRRVCHGLGIDLDVAGLGTGTETRTPETLLPAYDLVFASGRAALEALAVGSAVVVCNNSALAGLVTTKDVERMRRFNFGFRILQHPLTEDDLRQEIERYDRGDAAAVSEAVRTAAGLDTMVDRYEVIYRDAMADQRADPVGPLQEAQAEGRYLQWLRRFVGEHEAAVERYEWAEEDRHRLFAERVEMEAQRDAVAVERDSLRAERDELAEERDGSRAEEARLRSALSAMESTATWRARAGILSAPRIVRAPARLMSRAAMAVARTRQRPPRH
jgi:hypothetical protein